MDLIIYSFLKPFQESMCRRKPLVLIFELFYLLLYIFHSLFHFLFSTIRKSILAFEEPTKAKLVVAMVWGFLMVSVTITLYMWMKARCARSLGECFFLSCTIIFKSSLKVNLKISMIGSSFRGYMSSSPLMDFPFIGGNEG